MHLSDFLQVQMQCTGKGISTGHALLQSCSLYTSYLRECMVLWASGVKLYVHRNTALRHCTCCTMDLPSSVGSLWLCLETLSLTSHCTTQVIPGTPQTTYDTGWNKPDVTSRPYSVFSLPFSSCSQLRAHLSPTLNSHNLVYCHLLLSPSSTLLLWGSPKSWYHLTICRHDCWELGRDVLVAGSRMRRVQWRQE